jgi:hypothetical protein
VVIFFSTTGTWHCGKGFFTQWDRKVWEEKAQIPQDPKPIAVVRRGQVEENANAEVKPKESPSQSLFLFQQEI